MSVLCPLCSHQARLFRDVKGVAYFECLTCEFIFADPELLRRADEGEVFQTYDATYWHDELRAARERSYGASLARVAETLLYVKKPVSRFIDLSAGPGYLLDALSAYLPASRDMFYGAELFPPAEEFRSRHPNYTIGGLEALTGKFQAGVCIETFEHFTPSMARHFAKELARISEHEALFIFNTGLVTYVKKQDMAYLDPFGRGHITIWSVKAARRIFEPLGFRVWRLPGKTWAFAVEFQSKNTTALRDRIRDVCSENKAILTDPEMGSALYLLGIDSARASAFPSLSSLIIRRFKHLCACQPNNPG